MHHYLIRMSEPWYGYQPYPKVIRFEVESESPLDTIDLYGIAMKKCPKMMYGGAEPFEPSLPDGFKRTDKSIAPCGFYWANNGKSRFEKGYKSILVKE